MTDTQAAFISFAIWIMMVCSILIAFKLERIATALEKANNEHQSK